MNSKIFELNATKEKLAKLIDDLNVLEREFDKAIEHSSNYHGHDERIERFRDERAGSLFEIMNEVKNQISNQMY
ncbi:hypothetical protein [Erwinia sp. ErVv1]|uniref:hypothetical protein n=1 Tax=Erwinia sp. ErVv1 TaxID=1603299 RepID=UPI0008374C32|nr:hypothetical protein [Erwinia sp. ErVv1]